MRRITRGGDRRGRRDARWGDWVVHVRAMAAPSDGARVERCPAAYEAYGAGFLATERPCDGGVIAVISVNVVLPRTWRAVFYAKTKRQTRRRRRISESATHRR